MNLIVRKLLGSVIRHGLTALGAYLVAKGIATPEMADQFTSSGAEIAMGAVTVFSSVGLSFLEKKATSTKLAEMPPPAQFDRVPNIAKGRAGNIPLTLLLALSFLSLLALIGCATASGPSACERELVAVQLSLESCLAK